jgi:hypothetical protein
LAGDAGQSASDVAWGDYRGTLIIHLSTLKLRAAEGWLLCNLDVNEPSQPACTLQFLFRTARGEEVDPLVVAGEVRAGDPAASALADAWGAVLQRVVWDGILDVIEGVISNAGAQSPGRNLALLGFLGTESAVQVEVQTADA